MGAYEDRKLNRHLYRAVTQSGRLHTTFMAKIILIEDDQQFAQALLEALSAYDVDHIDDGRKGLDWLEGCHYDGAIIDWQLPSMTGVEVCKRYRQNGGTTPILMLTSNSRTTDQISGLDAGADDYLTKPCDMSILLAHVRALLRRVPTVQADVISIGRLSLDARQKVLSVDQHPLRLTKREYAIMELLIRAKGEPIHPTAILERVWPSDSEVSPESVRCHIARVRTQISKFSKEAADSIQSIYGVGYLVKAQD